jgi:N-methylhydantoinase B
VLEDVRNGYISVEVARRDYGVAIEVDSWQVNAAETGRLRAAMREEGRRA